MAQVDPNLSTGLPGLDRLLTGLIPGDNLVWQLDTIEDYPLLVDPYVAGSRRLGERLVYFRFAKHPPLASADTGAEIHQLDPQIGFEAFLARIHGVIERGGRRGFYVFDCLSDLSADWYSDEMLANFFMLTCPCLLDMEAIAYFALLRKHHSAATTLAVVNTAQVIVDVFNQGAKRYVYPLKVQQRHSPTMYMLHTWEGDEFVPVTESATTSDILTTAQWRRLIPSERGQGIWERTILRAEELARAVDEGQAEENEVDEHFDRMVRMMITRDDRVFRLVKKHMRLSDLLHVSKRVVGTGLIGGKSVGMLLARAVLRNADARWAQLLEPHDSFFIGSDVFYTFLVRNGVWWVRQRQRDPATFLEGAERARQSILRGSFPDDVEQEFADLLDYFGQSPIIVRSSSLLEDNFGNAFAGKYESVFCANQGSREKRLTDFESAVRTIYASTMSEEALRYRADRKLLDRDEQMALLVQRVSGAMYGSLFYPQVAGVAFSFNPYRWSEEIDPEAGMLRLVFGLGTRAVDRADDDYTRVVALNAPDRRPEAGHDDARQYAQRRVDILNLEANQLVTERFANIAERNPQLPVEMFASMDRKPAQRSAGADSQKASPWVLTFRKLLSETTFTADMRKILSTLQQAYQCPVDVEFTANFFDGKTHRINLLQCRPLQVKGGGAIMDPPEDIRPEDVLLTASGAVIGQGRILTIERIIYVVPQVYGLMRVADRYAIARLIGRLTHLEEAGGKTTLLLGPGRWGTTTPSLGIPARFSEISRASVVCEIVAMRENLIPSVSLGTHYFNDLVEGDILYIAMFPRREGNALNESLLEARTSKLTRLVPEAGQWAEAVRVIDPSELPGTHRLVLNANPLKQRAVCYFERCPL